MIAYTKPRIIKIDEEEVVLKIPLTRRNRNHLGSMYFGALTVGADISVGILAYYHAFMTNRKLLLVFKSFQAEFIKRAENDVIFICREGTLIKEMLHQSYATSERINSFIPVQAYVKEISPENLVAEFKLELSIKMTG